MSLSIFVEERKLRGQKDLKDSTDKKAALVKVRVILAKMKAALDEVKGDSAAMRVVLVAARAVWVEEKVDLGVADEVEVGVQGEEAEVEWAVVEDLEESGSLTDIVVANERKY